jgi:hypothetical protein
VSNLTDWHDQLHARCSVSRLGFDGVMVIEYPDADAALTLAHEHNLHIHAQTRTLLHVADNAGRGGREHVRLTVEVLDRHDLSIGTAQALLAWDTYATTGTFPDQYIPGADVYLGQLETRPGARDLRRAFTGNGPLNTWSALAAHHRNTRHLRELDIAIALDARRHTITGAFGQPLHPASGAEELLARLISDQTGSSPIPIYTSTGKLGGNYAALDHADLIDVVNAERRLTLNTRTRAQARAADTQQRDHH